jgi:hypothetical protein
MKRAKTLAKIMILARVVPLFMFVWLYVRSHILCTQLVICHLSHFIHIWYLDWPWAEHAHIIPILRMVDFCESLSPSYSQTNMKRGTTLARINHLWNRYNMRMPRSWSIKIPNMNKMRQKTNEFNKIWEFLYYLLNLSKIKLENLGSGNTFKEISTNNLKTTKCFKPKFRH